jgi:molecular chaperone DnaK
MGTTLGIDLGTTFCAVSHLDDRGRAITVPNRDGEILTPSAVFLSESGDAVVGQPALDLALEQPERVATVIKRRMGEVDYGRMVAGRSFRPETLSAIILRKLVLDAEAAVGPVSQVVITVPAYFDDTRRQATVDAGRIAGLDVLDILDEPSAAALAYTIQTAPTATLEGTGKTVLVYDLGGGTFDVTLVKLGKKRFQVLGIEGDVRLGGKDWDQRLVDHAAERFLQQFQDDPRADEQSLAFLQASAERAKRTLSKVEQASLTVAHRGHKLTVPITRAEFEALTRDLLLRTRMTTQQVLTQAGLTWDKVDKVLLVGGSTHMPMSGRMLEELTGQPPDRGLAVSEVVARGAAVHGGILLARKAAEAGKPLPDSLLADVEEISVNAHSLGVEIRSKDGERRNDKLVIKNTQLPAHASRVYFTAKEGQEKVRVRILQGEAQQAEACIAVGECWIDGLPEGMPKGAPIQVRCGVQTNGRIEVMALDMTNGRLARTEIARTSGLSDDEIAQEKAFVLGLRIQ